MNLVTFRAFRDEMEKIAVLGTLGSWLSEGWHGPANDPNTWFGRGIQPASSRAGKVFQQVTSLGGATKYLPVGNKALTVAFAVPDAIAAAKQEDPTGQGRSRAERVSSLVGTTAGGLLGAGAGSKLMGGAGMMLGGGLGTMLGSRMASLPFAHARRRREQAYQQALAQQQQQPQYQPPAEVPAADQPAPLPGVF